MKKVKILLVSILLIFLFGCVGNNNGGIDDTIKDIQEREIKISEGDLVYFEFSHRGMSMDDFYIYSLEETENGVRMYAEIEAGNIIEDIVIEDAVLDRIREIWDIYSVWEWDGFYESNNMVLDGEGFSLTAKFSDNILISAGGDNSFPPGYSGFRNEIETVFKELIYKYGDIYKKTLESDDIYYMFFKVLRGTKEFFKVNAINYDEGLVYLDIEIEGYEEYSPYEEYCFFGYGQNFPFDEIQKIIRDKNVPAWNGWDKVSDVYSGEEWFLMELEYDSEERIYATGQSYPENYDAVKDEILRKFIKYIEENKEFFIPYNEYNQE